MDTRHLTAEQIVLIVAAVVVVSVLAVATWSVASTSASTADRPEFDTDVEQRYESIDGIEARQTTTITRNGTVASQTTYVATLRPGTGKKRLEVVDSTAERYDLRVSNGSTLWLYDRSSAEATRLSLSGTEPSQGPRLQRLFSRLNMSTANDTTASRSVEPLPVVPQGEQRPAELASESAAQMGVSYRGTETVQGHETYVLHVAPENGTAAYEQTLWVDTEQFFPVKKRTAWTAEGERTVVTTTYANISYEPGVSDDVFTPDFTANTTVTVPETPETLTYRSVSALEADTEIRVPDPDIPPSFELTYATQTENGINGVGLRYVNQTSRIMIAKYDRPDLGTGGSDTETVTIDGQPAQVSRDLTASVSWSCESYRYTVRGDGVSAEQLIAIGQSVGCPASDK